MVSIELLEEGMWIEVDGSNHPVMPDCVRDYEVMDHSKHDIVVSNPSDSKNHIIFPEESDCIISSDVRCPDHGRKLYHDGKSEWYCPWC